ncbi:putative signaling protein [Nymphon striatum]|nr:putative signaling protein [Nymphon striatum]
MIITLMIVTSLVAASQIKLSANSMLSSIQQHSENNNQLRNMSHAETSRSTILVSMMQTEDAFLLNELYYDLSSQTTKFNVAREFLMMQNLDDTLKEMLEQQRKLSKTYEPMLEEVYNLLIEGKKEIATELLTQQTLPRQKAVLDLIKDMADYQHKVESEANVVSKKNNNTVLTSNKNMQFVMLCIQYLRITIKKKNYALQYQPLLNIKDGTTTECEALLRWTNQDGMKIPADDFIPLAEKTNLIEKLNIFVIDEACKQQSIWQRSGPKNIRININLSGNKIIFTKLLNRFIHNVRYYDLDPKLFGIELTERTIHEVPKDTIKDLENIRKAGVKISIDDFGTGYSSLSYLKNLPITTLKIDKEFIVGLPEDKADHALVKAIITLGHSLNLDVVAEGVETYEQVRVSEEVFSVISLKVIITIAHYQVIKYHIYN